MRKYLTYDPRPTHIAGGILLLSTVSADCLTPASAQGRAAAKVYCSSWPPPPLALGCSLPLPSSPCPFCPHFRVNKHSSLCSDTFVLFIRIQCTRICNINLNACSRPSRGLHIFPLTIDSIEMIESPNLLLFN